MGFFFMCMVFTPPLRHMLMICFCLSVERSQGIVLLEMSFICPSFLPRERERKRGRCIISTIRILYYYRVLVLGYWIGVRNRDRDTKRQTQLQSAENDLQRKALDPLVHVSLAYVHASDDVLFLLSH